MVQCWNRLALSAFLLFLISIQGSIAVDPEATEQAPDAPSDDSTPAPLDTSFIDDAELPHQPVLCKANNVCFYCPLALEVGGALYLPHGTENATDADVNQVGLKCLKSLKVSEYGILFTEADYVALGVVDVHTETDSALKELAETAYKKLKLVLKLVCGKVEQSPKDSSYCAVCTDIDSTSCKYQIRELCDAGFVKHYFKTYYNYKANFLWKALQRDTPHVCKILQSYRASEEDEKHAHGLIAQVIGGQCEEERLYNPCFRPKPTFGYGYGFPPRKYFGGHSIFHKADLHDDDKKDYFEEPVHYDSHDHQEDAHDDHHDHGFDYGLPTYNPGFHGSMYDYFTSLKGHHGPSHNDPYRFKFGHDHKREEAEEEEPAEEEPTHAPKFPYGPRPFRKPSFDPYGPHDAHYRHETEPFYGPRPSFGPYGHDGHDHEEEEGDEREHEPYYKPFKPYTPFSHHDDFHQHEWEPVYGPHPGFGPFGGHGGHHHEPKPFHSFNHPYGGASHEHQEEDPYAKYFN